MSEEKSTILLDVSDGVATVTLNRPERMNAWIWRMGRELDDALRDCDADDAVRVMVVTGAGRAFCAGADLGSGGKTFDSKDGGMSRREIRGEPLEAWTLNKPVIAAINGAAIGVGLTMALRYDMRIAARDAKLSFAFVNRGIVPELSSTWIVPRLVGVARASDLLLTGRIFSGEEAAELGLVNEAVERESVLERALEIARHIAVRSAPASVAAIKRAIWRHLAEPDPSVAARWEARALTWFGNQVDAKEGVVSFLKKRDPQWSMSPSDVPDFDEESGA
jgi:enoyl-CoA hydratase/carnithine racemase